MSRQSSAYPLKKVRLEKAATGCCSFNAAPDPSTYTTLVHCPSSIVDQDDCSDPFYNGTFTHGACPAGRGPYAYKFLSTQSNATECMCDESAAVSVSCPSAAQLRAYTAPPPVVATTGSNPHALFHEWVGEYDTPRAKLEAGSPEEQRAMFTMFSSTVQKVELHNASALGGYYTMALNEFAATPAAEFRQRFGLRPPHRARRRRLLASHGAPTALSLSSEFDLTKHGLNWALRGVVTKPLDQGECGSCFIYATVAAISAWYARASGKLIVFDPQSVVDLMKDDSPCDGGQPQDVVDAIVTRGRGRLCGLFVASDAASTTTTNIICAAGAGVSMVTGIQGFGVIRMLADDNETELTQAVRERRICDALYTYGCLVIAVASQPEWSSYESGVLVPVLTEEKALVNHAVLLVGFDNEDDGSCWWLIKNSWGPWGEGGFFRLPRGKNAAQYGADGPFGMYTFDPMFIK